MKSVKPGRGPSGMSFIGAIFAVIFGIFWTAIAFSMTESILFPMFGVLFIIMGIIQAVYHFKNATGKNRFSEFDITDSSEEEDPMGKWVDNKSKILYCPYCGAKIDKEFSFCPKCGKKLDNIK